MHGGAGIGTHVFLIAELQLYTLHSAASSVSCVPKTGFLPPSLPHLESFTSALLLSTKLVFLLT